MSKPSAIDGRRNGATRRFAEFFAGIGLMRAGLERCGWRAVYANDIEEKKFSIYRQNFPDAEEHFQLGDIANISGESIPEIDLATASFPCTDLSLAGARKGLRGKHSGAYWEFIRVLREMGARRPPLVLVENVTGFLTSRESRDFLQALKALNELNYHVDAFVLDASHFVPQSRRRLFIVASRNGAASGNAAAPETLTLGLLRPARLIRFIQEHPGIDWRIRPLPEPPTCADRLGKIISDPPAGIPPWWNAERRDYLLSQMSPKHRAQADRMKRGAAFSYGTVFRRVRSGKTMAELRTDGIAGCLRTPRGGSARQILLRAGRGTIETRLLQPDECGRLMGLDNGFKIDASLNQALFALGDAVCVPAIEWIGREYLNALVE